MLYLNQLEYSHIPYMHDLDHGGAPLERRNVGTSGCGLCCACMVVNHLTGEQLELEDCARLSEKIGANHIPGCSMRILGPAVAERYGLEFSMSERMEDVEECLRDGGEVIVMVKADENGFGIFTYRAHYMLIVASDGKEVKMLDPSYSPTKFQVPGREGKVRVEEPFVFCPIETLIQEARSDTKFCLFKNSKIHFV